MITKNFQKIKIHRSRWLDVVALLIVFLFSIWLIKYCRSSGIQHDYNRYLLQWDLVLNGSEPWSTDNAYGPLHTILGYLLPFGKMAPKYFMVGLLVVANAFLIIDLYKERGFSTIQMIYFLAIPANILFWGVGIFYGLNDALVAGLIVFAVILRRRNHFVASGALIALAALIKYYPLFLLPFFALDKKRLNLPLLASGSLVFLLGFAGSLLLWGDGPIAALLFNSGRDPKLLSLLAALKSVFGDGAFVEFLIQHNAKFVIVGVILTFIFAWKNKVNWLEGAVLGYLVMLTVYKVGHQQFYLPLLMMIACLPLINKPDADKTAIIFIPLVLFLSIYQYGYQFLSDGYHTEMVWIRSYGGFIAFAINILTIAAQALTCRRSKEIKQANQ